MRIAVGLSGGVDSAVAAFLLKRSGHEVVGVTPGQSAVLYSADDTILCGGTILQSYGIIHANIRGAEAHGASRLR